MTENIALGKTRHGSSEESALGGPDAILQDIVHAAASLFRAAAAVIYIHENGKLVKRAATGDGADHLPNTPETFEVRALYGETVVSVEKAGRRSADMSEDERPGEVLLAAVRLVNGWQVPGIIVLHHLHTLEDSIASLRERLDGFGCLAGRALATLSGDEEAAERQINDTIELRVAERTAELQDEIRGRERVEAALLDEAERFMHILDNAGQGFLSFGKSLKVQAGFSEECNNIFRIDLWGKSFAEVLYPEDASHGRLIESILRETFHEKDKSRQEVFCSLLPDEVIIHERYIHVEYKIITDPHDQTDLMMVILTDITSQRVLANQIEEERNTLRMVVKAVTRHDDLETVVEEFKGFCTDSIANILDSHRTLDESLGEISRHIHTFKGVFGQMDMRHVAEKTHETESRLGRLRERETPLTAAGVKEFFARAGLVEALERDLAILREILGDALLKRRGTVRVDTARMIDLEQLMLSILPPMEYRLLLPPLRRLRYRPFADFLSGYPEYVERLAARLEKSIYPLTIESKPILVNPDDYRPFAKALGHVFRNSIDHGIESTDERIEKGKDEKGRIVCAVWEQDNFMWLRIGDDGAGIDVAALRQRAVENGMFDEPTAGAMTDDEIIQLIFEDALSTSRTTTDISGRGMGLPAVRAEVEQLEGKIRVTSEYGRGTEFLFALPIRQHLEMPDITVPDLLDEVVNRMIAYTEGGMPRKCPIRSRTGFSKSPHPVMKDVTALVTIEGMSRGVFILSVDERLARHLVRCCALDTLTPEEEGDYLADTVQELTNTVLGNSVALFRQVDSLITFSTPRIIPSNHSSMLYVGADMLYSTLTTDYGECVLNLTVWNMM